MANDFLIPTAARNDLPSSYRDACRAVAECWRIDECKGWADKAAAIAAYARMSQNPQLEVDAKRIRLRAIRRLGELLGPFQFGTTGHHKRLPRSHSAVSRTARADARAIAKVPEKIFLEIIESDNPPGAKKIAALGTKNKTKSIRRLIDNNKTGPDRRALAHALLRSEHRLLDFIIDRQPVRNLDWLEVTRYCRKQIHRCRALLLLSEGHDLSRRVGDCVDEEMADRALALTAERDNAAGGHGLSHA